METAVVPEISLLPAIIDPEVEAEAACDKAEAQPEVEEVPEVEIIVPEAEEVEACVAEAEPEVAVPEVEVVVPEVEVVGGAPAPSALPAPETNEVNIADLVSLLPAQLV